MMSGRSPNKPEGLALKTYQDIQQAYTHQCTAFSSYRDEMERLATTFYATLKREMSVPEDKIRPLPMEFDGPEREWYTPSEAVIEDNRRAGYYVFGFLLTIPSTAECASGDEPKEDEEPDEEIMHIAVGLRKLDRVYEIWYGDRTQFVADNDEQFSEGVQRAVDAFTERFHRRYIEGFDHWLRNEDQVKVGFNL